MSTSQGDESGPEVDGPFPEYHFDYRTARPNRFAGSAPQVPGSRLVVLDPDIAQVFMTAKSVNTALWTLIARGPR